MGAPKLHLTQYDENSIAIVESLPPGAVIKSAAQGEFLHIIQKSGIHFEAESGVAKIMTETPLNFFKDALSSVLGSEPEPARLYTYQCNALEHKRTLLDGLTNHLQNFSHVRSVRDEALVSADEIFTNASKNAGHFYANIDKQKAKRELLEGKIIFQVYVDIERVIMICSDSFGLLNIPKLLSKISVCYEKGVAEAINDGVQGAGIGSFMIFNNCSSYYLAVEKDKRTVVGCTFQTSPRCRDKGEISKNIHLLSI